MKQTECNKCKDFVGHDKTDTDCAMLCDQLFLVDSNYTLRVLGPDGVTWLMERCVANMIRKNEKSETDRQKSLESIGLIVGLRKSPWTVMVHPQKGGLEKVLHWGTLFNGLKRDWIADVNKTNKLVQLAVNSAYPGTKRYQRC